MIPTEQFRLDQFASPFDRGGAMVHRDHRADVAIVLCTSRGKPVPIAALEPGDAVALAAEINRRSRGARG